VRPGYIRTEMTRANRSLPFLLEVGTAARLIVRGLEQGRFNIAFPFPTAALTAVVRLLPPPLYFRIARRWAGRRSVEDKETGRQGDCEA
jgi:hypothetical protein